jgi:signal transduction histidine kinase
VFSLSEYNNNKIFEMFQTNLVFNIILVLSFFSTIIIVFYGVMIFNSIKNYNEKSLLLQKDLEELKINQEKMILETEVEIQEQTFQFISREIHDNIIQTLSLAKLNLNVLDYKNPLEINVLVTKSVDLISKSLSDLNNLSKSLDADLIANHGLTQALQFELEKWSMHAKTKLKLEVIGEVQYIKTSTELIVFRIIQESLSNILKYANASSILIALNYSSNELLFTIKDNGIGFNPEKELENKKIGKKAGLKNMKQRAEMVGGQFIIESNLKKGTTISVKIPY